MEKVDKALETRSQNSFVALHPPTPRPFAPVLLTVGLCLIAPVAMTLALIGAMAPFMPQQVWGRNFLFFSLGVGVALGFTAGVRSVWIRLRLPGRGPTDFLPVRWLAGRRATRRVGDLVDQLASAPPGPESLPALKDLARALEKRDLYTRVHCGRVSRLCFDLVGWLGGLPEQCELARLAGLLHDIGKLHIPDSILFKASRLDDTEMEIIKTHPVIGADLIGPFTVRQVIGGVLHHHERMDGKGYPDGVEVGNVDAIARVISVCDTYDTLTSDRPYRRARSKQEAFEELRAAAGSQLDPVLVEALIEMIGTRQPAGVMAAFFPVGLLLRKSRHLLHTSTAPATAAVTAATVAATAVLGGTSSPPPRPLPAAAAQVEHPSDQEKTKSFAQVASTEVARLGGSKPRPFQTSRDESRWAPAAAPKDPPAGDQRCRVPITGTDIPRLPIVGCAPQLIPL